MQAIERINLPKPDTHCFDDDTKSDVWSYSRELVISTVLAHIDRLEAEIHASDLAVAEYRQQCLDNAQEIARLRAESEERLQNCVALVAENERLRKDAERYRWLKSAKGPNGRIVKQEKYMEDQEPTAIEACMACLSDDAATLHSVNPEDEVADNMLRAETLMGDMARLLEEVRRNSTREDDLPDGLLGRIDAVLDAV